MDLLNKTKIDKLGRTSVPAKIRKFLKIKQGDNLIWKLEEGKIIVEKDEEGKTVEEIIDWLEKNAPKCTEWEIRKSGYKIEGFDKWSKKKLGLKV